MKIISGSSNPKLTTHIAKNLNLELINRTITTFSNGEKRIKINDKLRGKNVILVQSFSWPVDSNIIETLLIIDALERMGVKHIYLIIPWMGYSFQDKVFNSGEPLSAKVIANIISNSYVKRVMLFELHNPSIPGFFSIPTDHYNAEAIFIDYIKSNYDINQAVVASPDFGGLKKARILANRLDLNLINIDKSRDLKTGQVTSHAVHGNVKGKDVIIYDDAILSGGTVKSSADILKDNGARKLYFIATHPIFCNNAVEILASSKVDEVIVSNTIQHDDLPDKIKQIDSSSIFSEAISSFLNGHA